MGLIAVNRNTLSHVPFICELWSASTAPHQLPTEPFMHCRMDADTFPHQSNNNKKGRQSVEKRNYAWAKNVNKLVQKMRMHWWQATVVRQFEKRKHVINRFIKINWPKTKRNFCVYDAGENNRKIIASAEIEFVLVLSRGNAFFSSCPTDNNCIFLT